MFRLLNVNGHAALEHGGEWFDLATLSGDSSLADPMVAVSRSFELHALSKQCSKTKAQGDVAHASLFAPVPRPRQVFAIGLNYLDHASEAHAALPPAPLTFTKFASCIAGPSAEVPLSGENVDWEVEVVVAIGTEIRRASVEEAWNVVAGLTLGQDISDRSVLSNGTLSQFSLGKSFSNYGPIGPALVSIDSFEDADDISLWCDVSGERVQNSRTSQLIFGVPVLVAYLSSICTLFPGDLIFTGTPSGVGAARGRFLVAGDVIASGAEVIGELTNRCVDGVGPIAL